MMRYRGIYWGWSDSDYQRLTAPESEGGYGGAWQLWHRHHQNKWQWQAFSQRHL